jgi:hypothetical protein
VRNKKKERESKTKIKFSTSLNTTYPFPPFFVEPLFIFFKLKSEKYNVKTNTYLHLLVKGTEIKTTFKLHFTKKKVTNSKFMPAQNNENLNSKKRT